MKRIIAIIAVAAAALSMVSCKPSYEKSITNLKAAIDGESTASAKYAAFAQKATEEGKEGVAALFRAASKAEASHVANHQATLTELGVPDYIATITEFAVDSTAANIQVAIAGETYETAEMYPKFIAEAEAEKCDKAATTLKHAMDAEAQHAALYTAAANGTEFNVLYICPICGDIYANQTVETCAICGVNSNTFLVEIGAPIAEAAPVVEAKK